MGTPTVVHRRDTRANQPAAAVGNAGVLFCVTDEGNIVERSNGTTWEAYSPSAVTTLDASDITFAPTTAADWDGGTDPGDVGDALDQLAERVNDIEVLGADVTAASNLTDNALVRGDGGAKGVQTSGVIVSDTDEISGYKGSINTQTGTTYTLQSSDTGKIVECTNGSAIAVTADPALPKGFACTIVQGGAGQVTIASSGSGTVVNRQSHTKTAGLNAMCALYVRSNSGSDAVFVLGGDTGT